MAKLCPTCAQKPQPPGTYRGSCNANASQNCKAWTDDFVLTLCDPCAEQLGRCAWCWGPLDGGYGDAVVPTTKQFVRVFHPHDNGKHVPGMNVGEQVLAQFVVDLYSGNTWRLNRSASSREVSYYGFRLIRDPQNWRQATLELYVDLDAPCEKAKLVFEEAADSGGYRWWSPPPPSGKPFELTVEIRR